MMFDSDAIRRRSTNTNRKLRATCESLSMSAMRPTTAFLRLPATAGVISAFCSSGESRSAPSNARSSATACCGERVEVLAVTTSARAFAYRAATAESVIVYLRGRVRSRRLQVADEAAHESVLRLRG